MRLRIGGLLLVLACVPSCEWDAAGSAQASSANIDANETYSIVGVESGKCVQIEDAGVSNRDAVELGTCRASVEQQFRLEPSSRAPGHFLLRNVNSGLCVDVAGVSRANGARIIQWSCGSGDNQLWALADVGSGAVRITARHSGKVLDVPGHRTADGTNLHQWSYAGQANQQFRLRPVGGDQGADAGPGNPDVDAGPGNGQCAMTPSRLRITEIDVGGSVVTNGHAPLALSPIPSGGSRLAWKGTDGRVHITTLTALDQVGGLSLSLPAHDFQDLQADDEGGVVLLTRAAAGGGTLSCGQPSNLCGVPPNPPVPCFDMYLVRFDGANESWATKLTTSSPSLPPYSSGPTGANVFFIWWYDHHGRIVTDGTNYAAYFGAAISVSQGGCINIHQGDRAAVVSPTGQIVGGGFDWGCSHSGFQRVAWDGSRFVYVCKNDRPTAGKSGRIALAPSASPILPVDLWYSDVGDVVPAIDGGYWLTVSDAREGQPPNSNGLADVRLLHFTDGSADGNVVLASDPGLNNRGPHLAAYGSSRMLAAWETSTRGGALSGWDGSRNLFVQTLDRATGAPEGDPLQVPIEGDPLQQLVAFPDGSVAYAAPGSSSSKVEILRVLPCP